MRNSTFCKIVTPENFSSKVCTRDYVEDGNYCANFGENRFSGGFSSSRWNITPLWLFLTVLSCPSCPVLFSRSCAQFDLSAGSTKRKGQGSQKCHKGVIFNLFGEKPPLNRFSQKFAVVAVPDVITCANFWVEIFRGYDFTWGRISRFPIDSFIGV